MLSNAQVGERTLPLPFSINDIPDQTPFVQAGMEYLCSLYDLKELFSTFDLDKLNVNSPGLCVLAQAQTFENGGVAGSYYDFIALHTLPSSPHSLGFATSITGVETAHRLTNDWKQAIADVLAE